MIGIPFHNVCMARNSKVHLTASNFTIRTSTRPTEMASVHGLAHMIGKADPGLLIRHICGIADRFQLGDPVPVSHRSGDLSVKTALLKTVDGKGAGFGVLLGQHHPTLLSCWHPI